MRSVGNAQAIVGIVGRAFVVPCHCNLFPPSCALVEELRDPSKIQPLFLLLLMVALGLMLDLCTGGKRTLWTWPVSPSLFPDACSLGEVISVIVFDYLRQEVHFLNCNLFPSALLAFYCFLSTRETDFVVRVSNRSLLPHARWFRVT